MRYTLFLFFSFIINFAVSAQPSIRWQHSFGGTSGDSPSGIAESGDRYTVVGSSTSYDGDVVEAHGGSDAWVININDTGILKWTRSCGGFNTDVLNSVIRDTNGWVFIGDSKSIDGDLALNRGLEDMWVVKLSDTGTIVWKRSFGGSNREFGKTIKKTTDGGYIVGGGTESNNGDVTGNHGQMDCWIVKLSDTGSIQWSKCYGGIESEMVSDIELTPDGGYIFSASAASNDHDVSGKHGSADCWIVKLDAIGNIEWQKCLGGTDDDGYPSIELTPDSGYIVGTVTRSNDGDVTGNHGDYDFWLVKLTASGTIVWQKTFGGSGEETMGWVRLAHDGNYLVFGGTGSSNGDVTSFHGGPSDGWLLKVSPAGVLLWQRTFGGSGWDGLKDVCEAQDSSIVFVCTSNSPDGDCSYVHAGYEYWVANLKCDTVAPTVSIAGSTLTAPVGYTTYQWFSGSTPVPAATNAVYTATTPGSYYVKVTGGGHCNGTSAVTNIGLGLGSVLNAISPILQVVPNPAKTHISIQGTHIAHVQLYNSVGTLVDNTTSTSDVNVDYLPPGDYYISAFNDYHELIGRSSFVKE